VPTLPSPLHRNNIGFQSSTFSAAPQERSCGMLKLSERNLNGEVIAEYTYDPVHGSFRASKDSRRTWSLSNFSDVFLPSGYPNSVTPDYTYYQIFDSLQAFCSSIAGLLSARAVLEGFGVGDENASSNYAMILKIAQDVTGRLASE